MTENINYSIADLLVHDEPMILIDEVISISECSICVHVDMSKPNLFMHTDGRTPSYVGIEFMAQTIAALVGFNRLQKQALIKVGFLLGTRAYKCNQSHFNPDQDLEVRVEKNMDDGELGVFDCAVYGAELIASAQLKAILPASTVDFLRN